MAILNIDVRRIELNVRVGVLENYKPDDEIREINEEVEQLKAKFTKSMNRIIGKTHTQAEALQILQKDESKRAKWEKYVNNTYMKNLKKLMERVQEKNKEICPNFEEMVLKKNEN